MCKEVLRAGRALLSEFKMKETEWPEIVPIIQSILNHTKRPSLGGVAPTTAFLGRKASTPLSCILPLRFQQAKSIEFVRAQRVMRIRQVVDAVDKMHKSVAKSRSKVRENAVRRHNARTHVRPVNFEVGDFVLVARQDMADGHKLRVVWQGPRRVVRADSDQVYECEDLISGESNLFHINRLKFYADAQLDVTESLLDVVDNNEPHLQHVERLLDIRFNRAQERYEVKVQWRGFDYEAPTWEPLVTMAEDVPALLAKFLTRCRKKKLARAARASLPAP